MTKPNDDELEQYLKGGSPLSRRYRDASRESAPPELDETVLSIARAEAQRRPNLNRWLTPVALAASLVLGVNLAWNLREQAVPTSAPETQDPEQLSEETIALAPLTPMPQAVPPAAERLRDALSANAPPEPKAAPRRARPTPAPSTAAGASSRDEAPAPARVAESEAMAKAKTEADAYAENRVNAGQGRLALVAEATPGPFEVPALTEPEKIERLIQYVATLQGAVLIRNGEEHSAPAAAEHLRLKLKKAGRRVKTAGDFIECCATRSSLGGEEYRIRFADGTTQPAGEVLREQLRKLEGAD